MRSTAPVAQAPAESPNDEAQVRAVVTDFGTKLQQVSLSASPDDIKTAVAAEYAGDVAPQLLASWEADPTQSQNQVPGRLTSSPWPDHIEIGNVAKNPDGSYVVAGHVIEVTSVEAAQGGVADSYPINLTVSDINGTWLISAIQVGQANPNATTTPDKG